MPSNSSGPGTGAGNAPITSGPKTSSWMPGRAHFDPIEATEPMTESEDQLRWIEPPVDED